MTEALPTVSLASVAEIRTSNVDKKVNAGERPVRLCNYMDVYSSRYITSENAFMEATATESEFLRFRVEKGDVLITKDSETPDDIGVPSVVVDDVAELVCGYHLALLKPRKARIDSSYLAKQLESAETARYYARVASGSTRYGLGRSAIAATPIRMVPLEQQRRIGTILSTLDEAIEQTEALIAKLQQVKAGLMHDLFTRGVLPDGRLRPTREEAPGLYEETRLGWLPRGWEVFSLGEVVPRSTYGISEALHSHGSVPVLRMNNIRGGGVNLEELKFSTSTAASTLQLRPGDILFNRTNSIEHVGRTGMWRGELEKASFASYLVRLEFDPLRIQGSFLNAWLGWEQTQLEIRRFATPGVHQVNINPTNLRRSPIALPLSLGEQDRIVACLAGTNALLGGELRTIRSLVHTRRGLMNDLLSGRVSVDRSRAKDSL